VTTAVLLWGMTLVGLCSMLIGAYVIAATRRNIKCAPTARRGLTLPAPEGGWPSVCVVIPAHNEELVIRDLVESLRAQDYPGEVAFVLALDRCTDDTERIVEEAAAGDDRFRIVRIAECPEGWAGKTNAAHTAVRESERARNADVLIFSDADTLWDPGCVRACVALLRQRNLDLLSLLSTLRFEGAWETRSQAVASAELVRRFPLVRVNRDSHSSALANGQFLCFERDMYERIGGHEGVRDELLEDLAFARQVRRAKDPQGRWGVLIADGMLRCRMYPSGPAFRTGWKRIFTEAYGRSPRRLRRAATRLLLAWLLAPLLALATLAAGVIAITAATGAPALVALITGAAALTTWIAAIINICAFQSAPLRSALWWPVGAIEIAGVLRAAAADLENGVPIRWAGKEYRLTPR